MKLYIAEKQSVGAAIARALGGSSVSGRWIECPQANVVTWLSGHVLRLAEPDEYDRERWKDWSLDTLPCVPARFITVPDEDSLPQLQAVVRLIQRALTVVNAGDPDREGQLIVDEVIEHTRFKGQVKRILPNSTTPSAIAKAIADERDNAEYRGLLSAGQGRQRADWLIGYNCTRAMTIASGDGRLMSVGRVKTPTLWLVVKRCQEIAQFTPRPYYELAAEVRTRSGTVLSLLRDAGDPEFRLWERAAAEALAEAIRAQKQARLRVIVTREQEQPPLPYRLRDFQMDSHRDHGWKATASLQVLQKLYLAGLLTYPRTDIAHLRDEEAARVPQILTAIEGSGLVNLDTFWRTPGVPVLSARVFDSSKVKEHHGIIPTDVPPRVLQRDDDRIAYAKVASRLLMALMPPRIYERTRAEAVLAQVPFAAVGMHTQSAGWRVLKPLRDPEKALPPLVDGEEAEILAVRIDTKMTVAPEYYTEASLLADMSGVHRFVDDPALKSRLRETAGIGTPATQAQTINDLQENGYVREERGKLLATQLGSDLIDNVPELLSNPAYTALMEEALVHVQEQRVDLAAFTASAAQLTERLVDDIRRRLGQMHFVPGPVPPRAGYAKKKRRSRRPRASGSTRAQLS